MMNLIDYTIASINIKVDALMSTVLLTSKEDESSAVFLDGFTAESFINRVNAVYADAGDLLYEEAVALIGYEYLDLLS